MAIREAFAMGQASKSDLARKYGLSHKAIRNILSGRSWKHVM